MSPAKRYRAIPGDLKFSIRCPLLNLQEHGLHLGRGRPASRVRYAEMVVAGIFLAYAAIRRLYLDPRSLAVTAREIERQLRRKHLRADRVTEQGDERSSERRERDSNIDPPIPPELLVGARHSPAQSIIGGTTAYVAAAIPSAGTLVCVR